MSFDIGTDTWNIDGFEITPTMRQEIVLQLIDMYASYYSSYEWRRDEETGWVGLRVTDEPHVVTSVTDYLAEFNGERLWNDRSCAVTYGDVFEEWLQEYIVDQWTDGEYPDNDEEHDNYYNAIDKGISGIGGMISDKTWEDILAWKSMLGESVVQDSQKAQR